MTTYTLTQAKLDYLLDTNVRPSFKDALLRDLKPNTAPMSKEDMVLELLNYYTAAMLKKDADEAITIMQSAIEGMK